MTPLQNVHDTLESSIARDPVSATRMLPLVYEELRRLARQRLAHEPAGITLQATALVHEAYLRLLANAQQRWDHRGHFFAAAAEAMRRILVERARRKHSPKHGGGRSRLPITDRPAATAERVDVDVIAVDHALRKLERTDPTRADIVMLRYFAGLTLEQTAEMLGMSRTSVARQWSFAKAWLYAEIESSC